MSLKSSNALATSAGSTPKRRDTEDVEQPIDVEICAGAGGMTLGLQLAGFRFSHVFEIDTHACTTLEHNHVANGGVLHGQIHEEDVTTIDWSRYSKPVRLLAGGAPCQPFSLAGRHLADRDDRNLFPEVLRAARSLQPQAIMLENVQGLARPSFRPYFEYILRQLKWPSVEPRKDEEWQDHDRRISQHQESVKQWPQYHVSWALLEAADFGVPQNRKRVFIVSNRSDTLEKFEFPSATHKKHSLLRIQNTGEYWTDRSIEPPSKNNVDAEHLEEFKEFKAWTTVRDVIAELPVAARTETESDNNHWFIPGARIYRGHTGSHLDWPSKTIKAGVHGVPGGENIVLMDDGTFRYYTLRETARIQGFPDEYIFHGARLHVTRQIGNAVPIDLARAVGHKLFEQISSDLDGTELPDSSTRKSEKME